MIKYEIYFAIHTSTQQNEWNIIDKITDNLISSDWCDGYTIHNTIGSWIDTETHEILEEDAYKIEFITDGDHLDKVVKSFGGFIKRKAHQKEVLITKTNIEIL
jgi:hypothetical protein